MMTDRTAGKAMGDLLDLFNLVRKALKGLDYFSVKEAEVWLKTESGKSGLQSALCHWAEEQFTANDWANRVFGSRRLVSVGRKELYACRLKTTASSKEISMAVGGWGKAMVERSVALEFLKTADKDQYLVFQHQKCSSFTRQEDGGWRERVDEDGRWSCNTYVLLPA